MKKLPYFSPNLNITHINLFKMNIRKYFYKIKNNILNFNLFLILLIFFTMSCENTNKSDTLQIYHLSPDAIVERDVNMSGAYAQQRDDFFAVKNFDSANDTHKNQIDNFVVQRLKADPYLTDNKNVQWTMTFFKYGDGIDENTKHQYDSDYAIHTLFAQHKEIAYYTFDNLKGYRETLFWENFEDDIYDDKKRKIIQDHFDKH